MAQIKRFKEEFGARIRQWAPEWVEELRSKKRLTAEMKPALNEHLKQYLQQLVGG